MSKRTHDLIVKTGTYEQNGEEKARWQNVGSVIQTDKGSIILFNRTFNPAGVVGEENSESVLVQMMPVDREQGGSNAGGGTAPF